MNKKVAFITGITGQDGSYLAEFLLNKNYEVHGMKRRASSFNTQRIDHLYQDPHSKDPNFFLHYGDLTDSINLLINYRESYGIFASNGILFNHESPRRGETFVTRKITRGLTQINEGLTDFLYLGNIDALRDWGHAKDYVEIQWKILQQENSDDYVIATGRQITVRKFIELTSSTLGWSKKPGCPGIIWKGKGLEEIGIRADNDQIVIRIDPRYYRPTEVQELLGDATKAKEILNWEPKTTLEQLVSEMVDSELKEIES